LLARIDAIGRKGPTDAQCAWLEGLVRAGAFPEAAARSLVWGRWEGVSLDRVTAFARACVEADSPGLFALASVRTRSVLGLHPVSDVTLALCEAVMSRAVDSPRWSSVANVGLLSIAHALLDAGRAEVVCDALARSLRADPSVSVDVRPVFSECAERAAEALWRALVPVIEARRGSVALTRLLEHEFAEHAPAPPVAKWIGSDARRASWVASWCSLAAAPIHPLTRALIERFANDPSTSVELEERLTAARRSSFDDRLDSALATLDQWTAQAPGAVAQWCRDATLRWQRQRERASTQRHRPTGS
jgi:hypothetical protein